MNAKAAPVAKFRLGRIVATPHALEVIPNEDILAGIVRHQTGDWGELPAEDLIANDQSLVEGTRLLSAYRSTKGEVLDDHRSRPLGYDGSASGRLLIQQPLSHHERRLIFSSDTYVAPNYFSLPKQKCRPRFQRELPNQKQPV